MPAGKKVDHLGIKVEMVGQIGMSLFDVVGNLEFSALLHRTSLTARTI